MIPAGSIRLRILNLKMKLLLYLPISVNAPLVALRNACWLCICTLALSSPFILYIRTYSHPLKCLDTQNMHIYCMRLCAVMLMAARKLAYDFDLSIIQ
jgi:hypothetical protein